MNSEYAFWAARQSQIKISPRFLLTFIATELDQYGKCWLSIADFSKNLRVSRNMIRKYLDLLSSHDLLMFKCVEFEDGSQGPFLIELVQTLRDREELEAAGFVKLRRNITSPPANADLEDDEIQRAERVRL